MAASRAYMYMTAVIVSRNASGRRYSMISTPKHEKSIYCYNIHWFGALQLINGTINVDVSVIAFL